MANRRQSRGTYRQQEERTAEDTVAARLLASRQQWSSLTRTMKELRFLRRSIEGRFVVCLSVRLLLQLLLLYGQSYMAIPSLCLRIQAELVIIISPQLQLAIPFFMS